MNRSQQGAACVYCPHSQEWHPELEESSAFKGLQTFLFGEKVAVAREGSGGQIVEGAMRDHKDAVEVSVHIDNWPYEKL